MLPVNAARRRGNREPAAVVNQGLGTACLLFLALGTSSVAAQQIGVENCKLPDIGPVLISYSYYEKDQIQLANFEFFISVGIGVASTFQTPANTEFVVVVTGESCQPCRTLLPLLTSEPADKQQLKGIWTSDTVTILQRSENIGMDFGAHNVTLEYVHQKKQRLGYYRFFIFLNSSVRGPFYPGFMPPGWQWTRAFTDRLHDDIKIVSSSLVCLPAIDEGGRGPKVESWAFAIDNQGLAAVIEAGVFEVRAQKLTGAGVVVRGEYGLATALLARGYNLATLMTRYPVGIDWRDERHWQCNNNVHPSRHGTYDGLSMHPYETVFVKSSWKVGEPFVGRYTQWWMTHADGGNATEGSFDEKMYFHAMTREGRQQPDR